MSAPEKKQIDRYLENVAKDPETGVMQGAEALDLGDEKSQRAVLMVHGFSGGSNNFNTLPQAIAEAGWRVRVMRLPGHGTSPYDFAQTSAADLITGVLAELQELRERYANVVLLGHSMGGALSCIAAAKLPVNGLILAAPYFAIRHKWYYGLKVEHWTQLLGSWIHWIHTAADDEPVNRPGDYTQIFSYEWLPIDAVHSAMEIARQAQEATTLRKLNMPLLLIHSKMDQITCPKRSQEIFEAVPSTRKRFVALERSNHVIFWDYEEKEIQQEVLLFLKSLPQIATHPGQALPAAPHPAPGVTIQAASLEEIRPVRHSVLRPGRPYETTLWDGDEESDTLHISLLVDGKIVAIASLMHASPPGEEEDHCLQIRGMAVLAEYQGKGYGKKILQHCLAQAKERQARFAWCNARASAQLFYEHCGFEIQGESFTIPKIGPHFRMFHHLDQER